MVVHVFNPSHDEALAADNAHYCPSGAARRTGAALWDIAQHWASADDVILRLPSDGSLRGAVMRSMDGRETSAAHFAWDSSVTAIEPWGWDRHIVGVLRRLGAPERLLPDDARLAAIRALSSRHTAVRVLDALRHPSSVDGEPSLPATVVRAESRWCTSEDAVRSALAAYGGESFCKQPWSCSGRGVWRLTEDDWRPDSSLYLRVRKTLREQGAVEVEPVYERVADFAMEFFAEADVHPEPQPCRVRYEGLSLFATHDGGAYAGNVVAPQAELRRRLESLAAGVVPQPLPLESLAERLCLVLAGILGTSYSGPLGVDMMLTPRGIHPCIEVNLRNTMGRVALLRA